MGAPPPTPPSSPARTYAHIPPGRLALVIAAIACAITQGPSQRPGTTPGTPARGFFFFASSSPSSPRPHRYTSCMEKGHASASGSSPNQETSASCRSRALASPGTPGTGFRLRYPRPKKWKLSAFARSICPTRRVHPQPASVVYWYGRPYAVDAEGTEAETEKPFAAASSALALSASLAMAGKPRR